jgi:hypothetical protein
MKSIRTSLLQELTFYVVKKTCVLQEITLYEVSKDLSVT